MKYVSGYVRSTGSDEPLENITVTVRDGFTGNTIPAGGMLGASANPVQTDSNGRFQWMTELHPGRIKVVADVTPGVEFRIRMGDELMQVGSHFVSDLGGALRAFNDGVIKTSSNSLLPAAVTGQRQVRVLAGVANLQGHLFETHTERVLSVAANTTLTTRKDLVVLEQHIGGAFVGMQNIGIVTGTANNAIPSINTNPDIFQMPIGTVTIPLNATSVTVADTRVWSDPRVVTLANGQVTVATLAQETKDYIAASFPGLGVKEGGVTDVSNAKTLDFADGQFNITRINDNYAVIELAPGGIGTSFMADGSVTGAKVTNNTITPNKLHSSWRPRYGLQRNDTDQTFYAGQNTMLTQNYSLEPGTYSYLIVGSVRATDTNSSSSPRGWLRILRSGDEVGAEFFYLPGSYSGNGDGAVVFAVGSLVVGDNTQDDFTLNLAVDQGAFTVNQRQLVSWVQRVE